MGCHSGQGFLFSRGLPADEVDVLIEAHEAALTSGTQQLPDALSTTPSSAVDDPKSSESIDVPRVLA
jgi:hypothetical protein